MNQFNLLMPYLPGLLMLIAGALCICFSRERRTIRRHKRQINRLGRILKDRDICREDTAAHAAALKMLAEAKSLKRKHPHRVRVQAEMLQRLGDHSRKAIIQATEHRWAARCVRLKLSAAYRQFCAVKMVLEQQRRAASHIQCATARLDQRQFALADLELALALKTMDVPWRRA